MKYARLLYAGALVAAGVSTAAVAAADRPVVVELFTSQGCSSCPPAEAFLVDLVAKRGDVLALAFHVDYWDRLGWKDSFSSAAATQRQRGYASASGSGQVYTPQMVVDGRRGVVGSNRAAVLGLVSSAEASADKAVPVKMIRRGGEVSISIGAGTGVGKAVLVGFDPQRETAVPRGENAGRTIIQANVVRSFDTVAEWRGQDLTLARPMPAGESAAVILQAPDGHILGAARLGG